MSQRQLIAAWRRTSGKICFLQIRMEFRGTLEKKIWDLWSSLITALLPLYLIIAILSVFIFISLLIFFFHFPPPSCSATSLFPSCLCRHLLERDSASIDWWCMAVAVAVAVGGECRMTLSGSQMWSALLAASPSLLLPPLLLWFTLLALWKIHTHTRVCAHMHTQA